MIYVFASEFGIGIQELLKMKYIDFMLYMSSIVEYGEKRKIDDAKQPR